MQMNQGDNYVAENVSSNAVDNYVSKMHKAGWEHLYKHVLSNPQNTQLEPVFSFKHPCFIKKGM